MNKQIRVFLAGLLLVIPFAVTFWVIWSLVAWIGGIGRNIFDWGWIAVTGKPLSDTAGAGIVSVGGALIVLVAIYLVGLLVHTLLVRRLVSFAETIIQRVPGVKTIYQSIRDLLKLFGSSAGKMGKVVLYHPNGGEMAMLGILTNEHPTGLAGIPDHQMVAVYLPLAYMLGGSIVYVPRNRLLELDMPVEQALKTCATAEITQLGPQEHAFLQSPPGPQADKS